MGIDNVDLDREVNQLVEMSKDFDPKKEVQLVVTKEGETETKGLKELLDEVATLAREIEVGGQTSYQNKFFVLNPVEYPDGTSGKSRQAIFEGAVRVENIKGQYLEYYKCEGEKKIAEAKILRAQSKIDSVGGKNDAESVATRLEGEGELTIAQAEFRQKELHMAGIASRAKHQLREVVDFYEEYRKNEIECAKKGFDIHDWNTMEVEDDYWRTVNQRKVEKAMNYLALGFDHQTGDSLPLQHRINVDEIAHIKQRCLLEMQRNMGGAPALEGGSPATGETKMIEDNTAPTAWTVLLKREDTGEDIEISNIECPLKDSKNPMICNAKHPVQGACSFRYCYALGGVKQ